MHKGKMSLKNRIHEWKYWHITRKTRKIVPWIARKLPTKLKYYVIIDGMVTVEPSNDPSNVSGMQMLELWQQSS
jgi:hypothetical protein